MNLFIISILWPLLQILFFSHQHCWILLIVPVSSFCTFPNLSTLLLGRDEDDQRYKPFTVNFYSGITPPSLLSSIPFPVIPSILPKISIAPRISRPLFSILFSHTQNIAVVWCCLALRHKSRLRQKKNIASLKDRKLISVLAALTVTVANHLPVMVNKTAPATTATSNDIKKKRLSWQTLLCWAVGCVLIKIEERWFPPDSIFSFVYLCLFSPHQHAFKQTPLKCCQVGINIYIYTETSTIGAIFPPNTLCSIFVKIFDIQNLRAQYSEVLTKYSNIVSLLRTL